MTQAKELTELMEHRDFIHIHPNARLEEGRIRIAYDDFEEKFHCDITYNGVWYILRMDGFRNKFRSPSKLCRYLNDVVSTMERRKAKQEAHDLLMDGMQEKILEVTGKEVNVVRDGASYVTTFPDGLIKLRMTLSDSKWTGELVVDDLFDSRGKIKIIIDALEKLELLERISES